MGRVTGSAGALFATHRGTPLLPAPALRAASGTPFGVKNETAVVMAFRAAVAGMRASILVSIGCQEGKPALMTQAGTWVFQVPDGYPAAVDGNGRTTDDYDASARVLPIQFHLFVPIWATTEQTEE